MSDDQTEGWIEYRRLILGELERLSGAIAQLSAKIDAFREQDLTAIKVDIAMLQVKAGVWGLLGGTIPVLILVVIRLVGLR